ncbi:MAG: precorrin-6y C5,15-methyltransferase (decarboxylating) subunit CbiE [Cyanobacteria bacterium P01_D01_bin.115]
MTPIQVVGIGLAGAASLPMATLTLIDQATVLAGGDRHLAYFADHPAERWPLTHLTQRLQQHLLQAHPGLVVVLTSGDPLFFGLGRQLLQALPATALTFHPHVSSMQLAFSRVKLPWQAATWVSAHGRSLTPLALPLKQGETPIAVLTDGVNTPAAIARFVMSLALPTVYQLWICENLGGAAEQVHCLSLDTAQQVSLSPLNVVILERLESAPLPADLPRLGVPDQAFLSFRDRPGLMTKREVRVQILAELALQPHQVIWDIGAGTGSVSIEIARLMPESAVWAIEKTAMGYDLIQQNSHRFSVRNVNARQGEAPAALSELPAPHRIFIGGSGQQLTAILNACAARLQPGGRIVAAIATLENLAEMTQWLQGQPAWQGHYQQIALSRSAAVGPFTRWMPLNPVTLACLSPVASGDHPKQLPQESGGDHHQAQI